MKMIKKAIEISMPKLTTEEIIFDYCPSQYGLEAERKRKCSKDKDCRKCWDRDYKE